MVRGLFLFCIAALVVSSLCAQDKGTDSLQLALRNAATDLERVKLNLQLSDHVFSSDPLRSLECADEAERLAKKIKNDSLLYRSYLAQGTTYLHLGNYSRALQLYQRAITGAQQLNDHYMLLVGFGNIGNIYYFQRDHDLALKNYLEALDHFNQIKVTLDNGRAVRKANLVNNIGIIYEEKKEFEKAMDFYNEAYALGEKLHETEIMANVLNNKGTLFIDQGDNDKGFQFYNEAMELRRSNKNKAGLVRSYNNIGQFLLEKTHDLKKAETYLQQGIALGTEIGAWQTVGSSSQLLYRLYQEKGDYKKALETLELNRQVSDSLFNEQSTRKIAQLEMQFEFDRKQSEEAAQQKEKELYFYMMTGGLMLLLTIVTLLFFLQRNKTRRSQLEQAHLELEKVNLKNDLEQKDKELATNIMYLLNKNELINTISEKLLTIKQNSSPDAQGAVQKIILDLQSNLQPELWQEFEFRFQQVHEHFYKTLNERFPDLSPSEVRLCAFLKLNMTTKEISAITHQNAKSIDVARTRLRKKLNLTGTDHNLVTFLASLEKSSAAS